MAGQERCASHLGRARRRLGLTDALEGELCQMLRAGVYLETAALAAGVPKSTVYDWLARGQAAPPGARGDEGRLRRFADEVERARARGEAHLVTSITRAARDGDWRAGAWLLERTQVDRYAKPSQRAHVAPGTPGQPAPDHDPGDDMADLEAGGNVVQMRARPRRRRRGVQADEAADA